MGRLDAEKLIINPAVINEGKVLDGLIIKEKEAT